MRSILSASAKIDTLRLGGESIVRCSEKAVLGVFAVLRFVAVVGIPPSVFDDSASYTAANPSFTGAHERLWTVPLLYRASGSYGGIVALQTALSVACWAALAVALSRRFTNLRVKWAAFAGILVLGLTPRVTGWDTAILSESVAISFTVALLAAGLAYQSRRWSPLVFVAVFTFWMFARDAHVYLAPFVSLILLIAYWRTPKLRWFAVPLVAVMVWGFLAIGNNQWVEGFNVATDIGALHNDTDWFVARGMPHPDLFDQPADLDRAQAAWDDPNMQAWATTRGIAVYDRYLISHPAYTMRAFSALVVTDRFFGTSVLDDTGTDRTSRPVLPVAVTDLVWPTDARLATMALGLLAVAIMVARRRPWRGVAVPLALIATTIPHAVLVYHGSPMELGRHGVVLALVLQLSAFWILLTALDSAGSSVAEPGRVSVHVASGPHHPAEGVTTATQKCVLDASSEGTRID